MAAAQIEECKAVFNAAVAKTKGKPLSSFNEAESLFSLSNKPALRRTLYGHVRKVQAFAWHPNPDPEKMQCIAADQGGKCLLWHAKKGLKVKGFDTTFSMCAAMHPTDGVAAIGGMRNLIEIVKTAGDGATMDKVADLTGPDGYISSMHFLGGAKLISAAGDGEIQMWDISAKKCELTIPGHTSDAVGLCYPKGLKDKNTFATASSATEDKTCRIWDIRTNKCVRAFETEADCNCVDFFPSGEAVAVGNQQGVVEVFDLRSCQRINKIWRKNNRCTGIQFSLSGRILFTSYEDGAITVFDPFIKGPDDGTQCYKHKIQAHGFEKDGKSLKGAQDKERIISQLWLAPDGSAIASGGFDGLIKLWAP
jgi:WD40 repeat protein